MLGCEVHLFDAELNQIFVCGFFREYGYEVLRGIVDFIGFGLTVLIAVLLTEGHITVSESVQAKFADTVDMPEGICEINPFLAAIAADGRIKKLIHTWIRLIQKRDEIAFRSRLLLHEEIKLGVHGLQLFACSIHD